MNIKSIDFLKCHGSGNDFVLIDESEKQIFENEKERINFSILINDRKKTIGADGVLFLCKSEILDYKMRMFNPDGSEAEMCGNGLRCVGRLACEKLKKNSVKIEVSNKEYLIKKEKDLAKGIETYSVVLSHIYLEVEKLPIVDERKIIIQEKIKKLDKRLRFTAIGMPNPHLITFYKKLDLKKIDEKIVDLGRKITNETAIFPKGINISFSIEKKEKEIFTRTFERGVGLTNSCGTAMCASAIAYVIKHPKRLNNWIKIQNNGGFVKCKISKINGKFQVKLMGNASFIFAGKIKFNPKENSIEKVVYGIANMDEIVNYQEILLN